MRLSEQHRATLRWVFTGPDGIRAGWSILLFVAILAGIVAALNFAVHAILGHHPPPHGDMPIKLLFVQECLTTGLVLAATWIMGRIENRPFWSYGLAPNRAAFNCVVGAVCGFAALSALVAVLYAAGFLVFDGWALHGIAVAAYGITLLFLFFLVGVFEETLFRGYALATLSRGIGFWPASVVMAVLFAAAHTGNPGETFVGILQVFVAGMLLSTLLRLTGSLWLSIGFHMAWDWSQSFLYGTPDSGIMFQGHLLITHAAGNTQLSGGTTGPEGSLIASPILIAGLLALIWGYRNTSSRQQLA